MAKSDQLPKLTAPAYRETKSGVTITEYLRGDLNEVRDQAAKWVQTKALEEIAKQIQLGNSKQYTAIVDGSRSKDIAQAERNVRVYFVTAVLARTVGKAKEMLTSAILRTTTKHTGFLSNGWSWYLQRGGKRGPILPIGDSLPTDFELFPSDSLLLVPHAAYTWFANYYVKNSQAFKLRRARYRSKTAKPGRKQRLRPQQSIGFMAYTARRLRTDLKQIGFHVYVSFTRAPPLAPPDVRNKFGVPILVFRPSRFTGVPGG